MKTLLLFLMAASAWGAPCAGANGYAFCQTLVLDHTKVAANLSNYPAAICFGVGMGANCLQNSKQLATAANGGFLQDSTHGYDFIFTSDSGGTMPYTYETSIHNLVTGDTEIWILIPSASSTVDLTVYMFYGNASITTDQSNATAVWDSDYLAVHHMQLTSGQWSVAVPLTDSTGANPMVINDVSGSRFPVDAIVGVVGGAADLATGSSVAAAFINGGPFTNFPANGSPGPFTLEGWFNVNGAATSGEAYCFGNNATDGSRWALFWTGSGWLIEARNRNVSFAGATSGWHRIVTELPSGQNNLTAAVIYIDGVLTSVSGAGGTFAPFYTSTAYSSGVLCGNSVQEHYKGYTDELRFSKIQRSADWVLTDYNNQSNVKAFWSNSTTGTSSQTGRTIIIN